MMNKRKFLIISVLAIFVVAMSLSAVSAKSTSKNKTIKVSVSKDKAYTINFSAKQYKKIKKVIKVAKKKKFLYKGFKFKAKTNNILKTNKGNLKIYAIVEYDGWSRYNGGEHFYYPYVEFYAMKNGHKYKYLGASLVGYNFD